jgi:hypothetical protein
VWHLSMRRCLRETVGAGGAAAIRENTYRRAQSVLLGQGGVPGGDAGARVEPELVEDAPDVGLDRTLVVRWQGFCASLPYWPSIYAFGGSAVPCSHPGAHARPRAWSSSCRSVSNRSASTADTAATAAPVPACLPVSCSIAAISSAITRSRRRTISWPTSRPYANHLPAVESAKPFGPSLSKRSTRPMTSAYWRSRLRPTAGSNNEYHPLALHGRR